MIKGKKKAYNNRVQGGQNTQDSIIGEHVDDIANISKVRLTTCRVIHCVTEPASVFSHIHGGNDRWAPHEINKKICRKKI
jgi:hypothetical protein